MRDAEIRHPFNDMTRRCMRRLASLAAPQIGVPLRIFAVDVGGPRSVPRTINPEFAERDVKAR